MTSDNFERYTPQHPLPQELQKLDRDDTVCQFCGVSYLIHNEIKALEDKLKQTEDQLRLYKQSFEKNKVMEKEISDLRKQVESQKADLETTEERVTSITASRDKLRTELNDSQTNVKSMESTCDEMKQEVIKYRDRSIRVGVALETRIKPNIINLHHQYSQLKKDVIDFEAQMKEEFHILLRGVIEALTSNVEKYEKAFMAKESKYNDEIRNKKNALKEVIVSKEDMETKMNTLQAEYQSLKEKISFEASKLTDITRTAEEEATKSRQLALELDQYKTMFNCKIKEQESWQKSLKQREKLLEDRFKLMESQYLQCKYDLQEAKRNCDQYKEKCDQLLTSETEFLDKQNSTKSENTSLKEMLNETREQLSALKVEREKMILAHQTRMEQLKESYRAKLKEANDWPEKIDEMMKAEKNRHAEELANLEQRLLKNYNMDLEIEKEKHMKMLKKQSEDIQHRDESEWREKLMTCESRYNSALKELKTIKDIHAEETMSITRAHEIQIEDLQTVIMELRQKLDSKSECDPEDLLILKRELVHEKNETDSYKKKSKTLEDQIETLKEEISHLQDTVRRECEERFELTQTLSSMKEEILTLRKPPQGYKSSRQPKQQYSAPTLSEKSEKLTIRRGSQGNLEPLQQPRVSSGGLGSGWISNSGGLGNGVNTDSMRLGASINSVGKETATSAVAAKRRLAALMASQRQQRT